MKKIIPSLVGGFRREKSKYGFYPHAVGLPVVAVADYGKEPSVETILLLAKEANKHESQEPKYYSVGIGRSCMGKTYYPIQFYT